MLTPRMQLRCPCSGHPQPSNTMHRKILSEQERGPAWILPAAGRTWVILVGQTSLAWLDSIPTEGIADLLHSGTLILEVAAKHEANMPCFRRDGGDS